MVNNFKDPNGVTTSWLEKLAAFDYELQHRPGKSNGHADGPPRIPIVDQVATSQYKENQNEPEETKFWEPIHENGNLFESKDSLAHCILSSFEMSAGIAGSLMHKFPYKLPQSTNSPLLIQRIHDLFIYQLVSITNPR